jgi:hypothetical protein
MISFFILLIFIIILLYSEYIAKHNDKKNSENFTDFRPVINRGKCSRSLTQIRKKFYGNKVINPYPKCTKKKFNWPDYFRNAQFQTAPFNSIYY